MGLDRNAEQDPNHTSISAPTGGEPSVYWVNYANVVSRTQGYRLDEAQLARVVAQLELISVVAAPLLAIHLPAEVEPAPVFEP